MLGKCILNGSIASILQTYSINHKEVLVINSSDSNSEQIVCHKECDP